MGRSALLWSPPPPLLLRHILEQVAGPDVEGRTEHVQRRAIHPSDAQWCPLIYLRALGGVTNLAKPERGNETIPAALATGRAALIFAHSRDT